MPLFRKPVAAASSSSLPYPVPGVIPATPRTGRFYVVPVWGTSTATTQSILTGSLHSAGFSIAGTGRQPVTLNIAVSTAATGGSLRAALYNADDSLEPTTFIADLGTADGTTTGNKTFTSPPNFPAAGNYAIVMTSVTANVTVKAYASHSMNAAFGADPSTIAGSGGYRQDSITLGSAGTWPTNYASTTNQGTPPRFTLGY